MWEMVRLGDVAREISKWQPTSHPDESFTYIDLGSVDNELKSVVAPTRLLGVDAPSRARQQVVEGDVLVSTVRPNLNAVAVVTGDLDGATASTGFAVLRASNQLVGNYLFHWVRSPLFVDDMVRKATGASYPAVSERIVKDSLAPLPPLEEQRRIAAILDEADMIRTKRRAQLALLDELPQSLFHEMFGAVESETVTLSSLAEISSGITKGRRTGEAVSSVPYLAVANVQAGSLQLKNVKQIDATHREITRYALEAGDVVMTEGGDPDKLGRGALWSGEIEPCLHQNHIFRVRFPSEGRVRPAYFAEVLKRAETRRYFLRSAKKTTGIASINMSQLKALPVPVPSLEKQQSYLAKVEAIQAERSRITTALKADDELFAALQYRAFRGEL